MTDELLQIQVYLKDAVIRFPGILVEDLVDYVPRLEHGDNLDAIVTEMIAAGALVAIESRVGERTQTRLFSENWTHRIRRRSDA